MKVLHIGKKGVMDRYIAPDSFVGKMDRVDLPSGLTAGEYLENAKDADFIIADAIAPVTAELIENMPNLKLIHSEGVAFHLIDTAAAKRCGVYVCNSKGMNATAVAEQTILLMLGVLHNVIANDAAVREGRQITVKENYMKNGNLLELGDCSVGLIGFGDIGRETARLLRAHGVEEISYYKRTPLDSAEEEAAGVHYKPLDALLAESDIVSLHLPVTPQTKGMADSAFFAKMKEGAYFVNTSRGELVDDSALIEALRAGRVSMAALDTLNNEPVQADHSLLNVPDIADKFLFSPHIGGITASSFKRSYGMIQKDIEDMARGRMPKRIVNK